MATVTTKENARNNDELPRKSFIENLKNVNVVAERLKSWGALLLGVAAIITAFSTWKSPSNDSKVSNAIYTELTVELKEQAKDIQSIANDIEYLFKLKEQEETVSKENSELLSSHEKIEEMYLKQYLTAKYGPRYAREFLERKKKLQQELRLDVIKSPTKKPNVVVQRDIPEFKAVQEKALKK
jgi:hypothetical protein